MRCGAHAGEEKGHAKRAGVGGKEKGGRGGTTGPPAGQRGNGEKKKGRAENGRKVNFSKTNAFLNLFFNSKPNSNGI